MENRVIFLQPGLIGCYQRIKGFYVVEQEWTISGDKVPEQFKLHLRERLHATFSLIVDLPEEECHLEELKNIGLRDRRHVVQRLKNKRFKNALLFKTEFTGPSTDKRLLMSSIDGNSLCENLIAALMENQVCLSAIHSPTTLTPLIAKQVLVNNDACLVIISLHNGYRLVACSGRSVIFTRRIAGTRSAVEDSVTLQRGLHETLQYLHRQHPSWKPSVVSIGQSAVVDELKSNSDLADGSHPLVQIKCIDQPECLSVTAEPPESLLSNSLAKSGRGYADKSHCRAYMRHKVRNICAAMALCSMAGAATSTAVADKLSDNQEIVASSYRHSVSAFNSEIGNLEAFYEQPVEAVRQALVAARLVDLGSQEPVDTLRALGSSVNQQSDISISSVIWVADEPINETQFENVTTPSEFQELVSLEQIYRVTLAGSVSGAPESAFNQFESFVAALRSASTDPSVVVVEAPFGQGNHYRSSGSDSGADQSEFVIEISNRNIEQ